MAGLLDNQYRFPAGAGVGGIYKLPKGYNVKNELKDIALLTNSFAPVTGDIQSGILAANDLKQGNYGSAALNGLGILPFIPSMAGMIASKGSALAGVIKPLTKYELAHQTAQKNAVEMLGLPSNNTAMDRANALGFDTENTWLHGTRNDFNEFSKTKDIGFHFGDKWQANDRAGVGSGSNVIPVHLKTKNTIKTDDVYGTNQSWKTQFHIRDKGYVSEDDLYKMYDQNIVARQDQAFIDLLKSKGYDSAEYDNLVEGIKTNLRSDGTENTSKIVFNPNQIRSRFAAFDPARISEPDILGRATPEMLGLLAVGSGAGVGYAYNKKEKKKTK